MVPETPSHLFFDCALAQSVLGWIQSLIFRASNQCPSLLRCHVLFGFSASERCVVPCVCVFAEYFLWRARNDHRFSDVRPGAIPLMEVIKPRAKVHLCLFFKRFRSPHRQRYFLTDNGLPMELLVWYRMVLFIGVFDCFRLPYCLTECVSGYLVAFIGCTGAPFAE